MPISRVGEDEYSVAGMYTVTRFAEDAYYVQDDSEGMAAEYKILDDGTHVLDISSAAYVTEKGLIAELVLMCLYVLCAVAAAVLLIIKLIKVIAKKYKSYEGAKFVTAAQGIIGCIVQMICFAVCLASVFVSVKALIKGGKGKFKYIVNVLGNVSFAAAMIVFELMKFWGV